TSYALQGALFRSVMDNLTMGAGNLTYQVGDTSYSTLAEAYVQQAIANGEDVNLSCVETLSWLGSGDYEVVADCEGVDCPPQTGATVDASSLACGAADDLAAGLVGMHTGNLWITRLDAELPRAALAQDLVLQAANLQEEVQHRVVPFKTENECGGTTSVQGASLIQPRRRGLPGGLVPITLGALGVAWWLRRRKSELELV
ncbi:MAG: hypothetical protein KC731_40945, partial [Myxococcales bacterium]|nr:hypothetical protein [Myxococcales bacterium]